MGISYTVTTGGQATGPGSGGVVGGGEGGGWIFPPNQGNPTTPQPPTPKQPQPQPPSVTFSMTNLSDGLSVKCSLLGATPNSVSWAFNDAFNSSASGTSVVHTFPRAGTYTITMEANYGGRLSIVTKSVTLTGAPVIPVASFTSTVDGLAVLFANSSNFAAGSVSWDFGDGDVFSGQSVIHVYDAPGTYTVKMTADSLIATNTVTTVFLTGFGPIFWQNFTHSAIQATDYGISYNLKADSNAGVNLGSANSTLPINEADIGSGVRAFISGGDQSTSHGTHSPYFGLTQTVPLPGISSLMYGINFYHNDDSNINYAYVVESGVVVNQLDPTIISSIGANNIYFSITINESGQIEYRYGTVTWSAGNFVSYGPSTLWYTSTVPPSFPLYAAASLSYVSYPV